MNSLHEPAHPRKNLGRRLTDIKERKLIQIHPLAITIGVGVVSVLLASLGFLIKTWGENMTYEIRQLRLAVEKQSAEAAINGQWKTEMSKWRDTVDGHFKEVDNRLDTLPWATKRSVLRAREAEAQTISTLK